MHTCKGINKLYIKYKHTKAVCINIQVYKYEYMTMAKYAYNCSIHTEIQMQVSWPSNPTPSTSSAPPLDPNSRDLGFQGLEFRVPPTPLAASASVCPCLGEDPTIICTVLKARRRTMLGVFDNHPLLGSGSGQRITHPETFESSKVLQTLVLSGDMIGEALATPAEG